MYMVRAHTKLCRTHDTQDSGRTRHFGDGAGWDTEGNKEKPVHRQEAAAQAASWRREGDRDLPGQGERDQTTCKKDQI